VPIAITLQLRPSRPWRPDTHQLHGLACSLFEPSRQPHHQQDKPFAVWPVRPDPADPHVGLILRGAWLQDAPLPVAPTVGSRLRLGSVWCTITDADEHKVSYAELAASAPVRSATLAFWSPTYFSHNGVDLFTPEPRLILGSWRRRWNHAHPPGSALLVDNDLWQRLHRALQLRAFALQTEEMDSGYRHPQTGFVGQATLALNKGSALELRSVLATLVRFASFAGTGARTTHGFGATTSDLDGRWDG
jgi:CRISPR/Cas system endoribonuclease Cas6 (RAMP superfamily)